MEVFRQGSAKSPGLPGFETLLQQCEHALRLLVGLGQHRG